MAAKIRRLISGRMAKGVVDFLEMIQVEEQQRNLLAVPTGHTRGLIHLSNRGIVSQVPPALQNTGLLPLAEVSDKN